MRPSFTRALVQVTVDELRYIHIRAHHVPISMYNYVLACLAVSLPIWPHSRLSCPIWAYYRFTPARDLRVNLQGIHTGAYKPYTKSYKPHAQRSIQNTTGVHPI